MSERSHPQDHFHPVAAPAGSSAAPAGPDGDELSVRLRERGLRVTPQRVQVLETVRVLQHATPEQVSERLPDVDLATVYRTLELLEELGLVRHTHLNHGAASYRPAEDDHVHVICHNCGAVLNAPADLIELLAGRLRQDDGFSIDRSHLTVFGSCRECSAAAAGNKNAPGSDTD